MKLRKALQKGTSQKSISPAPAKTRRLTPLRASKTRSNLHAIPPRSFNSKTNLHARPTMRALERNLEEKEKVLEKECQESLLSAGNVSKEVVTEVPKEIPIISIVTDTQPVARRPVVLGTEDRIPMESGDSNVKFFKSMIRPVRAEIPSHKRKSKRVLTAVRLITKLNISQKNESGLSGFLKNLINSDRDTMPRNASERKFGIRFLKDKIREMGKDNSESILSNRKAKDLHR